MTLWVSDPRFGIKLCPMVVAVLVTLFQVFYNDDGDNWRHLHRADMTIGVPKHTCVFRDQIHLI